MTHMIKARARSLLPDLTKASFPRTLENMKRLAYIGPCVTVCNQDLCGQTARWLAVYPHGTDGVIRRALCLFNINIICMERRPQSSVIDVMLKSFQPASPRQFFGHSVVRCLLVIKRFNVFLPSFSSFFPSSSHSSVPLSCPVFSDPLRSLVLIFRAFQANQGRGARWVGR